MKTIVIFISLVFLGFTSNSQTIQKEFKVAPGKKLTVDPRSSFRSRKRSTELCKNPSRLRPSSTNRRLTSP